MFRLCIKVRIGSQCATPKVEAPIAKFYDMLDRFINGGFRVRFFDFDKQVWAFSRDRFSGAFKKG